MNTSDIINILKQHKEIENVVLEKTKNLSDIWDNYVHAIYHNSQIEKLFWDEKLKDQLRDFKENDSLDVMNKKGRILKRFAHFYKMQTGVLIPDNIMGIMGDALQAMINKDYSTQIYIDFTNKFDWDDGDFGKSGSCWWGTYGNSLPTFEQNGGWCIRFYDENKNGIGRTWLYPDPECNCLLGFNSYGIERAKVSKVIKKIFDTHGIELHYSTCSIENSNDSNIPYINSGTGFVLHTLDTTPESEYDLDMEVVPDENHETCAECGCRLNTDDGDYQYINDDYYCSDCVNNKFSFCDKCEEYHEADDVHSVGDNRSKYSYLCEYCANSLGFILCSNCGEYTEYAIEAYDTGNCFCENCSSLFYCEKCENYFENSSECPDCEDDEEENEETEQDTSLKYKDLIVESKNVYFTNCGDKTVNIYRFDNIPGLIVCKNTDWMVYHSSTKLAAMSNITTFDLAIECMIKFGELTDWSKIDQNILALPENAELRSKGIEIQRYIRSKM